jgi:hypothetical protein
LEDTTWTKAALALVPNTATEAVKRLKQIAIMIETFILLFFRRHYDESRASRQIAECSEF